MPLAALIFLNTYVLTSPIFFNMGWRGIYSTILLSIIFIAHSTIKKTTIKQSTIIGLILITLLSTITAMYWLDIRYIFANIFFISAFVIINNSGKEIISKVIDYATIFLLVVIIGAIIGFTLAFFGMPAMYEIQNTDGRTNYFYYTTFSNAVLGHIIRPAGVYDEPGALSLYICATAASRSLMKKGKKLTWILLILGFITFSVAHLVYVIFHLVSEKINTKRIMEISIFCFLIIIGMYFAGIIDIFDQMLFQRLYLSDSYQIIEGNNRWDNLNFAYNYLSTNMQAVLFGADISCRFDLDLCSNTYGSFGENPLAPLMQNGIFLSWIYYALILFFLTSFLAGRVYFVTFGYGLLLLQRPDVLAYIGSMLALIVLYSASISMRKTK